MIKEKSLRKINIIVEFIAIRQKPRKGQDYPPKTYYKLNKTKNTLILSKICAYMLLIQESGIPIELQAAQTTKI